MVKRLSCLPSKQAAGVRLPFGVCYFSTFLSVFFSCCGGHVKLQVQYNASMGHIGLVLYLALPQFRTTAVYFPLMFVYSNNSLSIVL